jgi:hypothetical protein
MREDLVPGPIEPEGLEVSKAGGAAAGRADFLVAIMGGRGRALALLIGPSAIGLVLSTLASLLGFGTQAVFEQGLDPSEIPTNAACLMLQRNLALLSFAVCPFGAACVLAYHWRILGPEHRGGVAIDRLYGLIAGIGALVFVFVLPEYTLFGHLAHATCRVLGGSGISGLIAAAIAFTLIAPLVTIAAVTVAYHLLQFENRLGPLRAQVAALAGRPSLKQIGVLLIALGLVYVGYLIGTAGENHGTAFGIAIGLIIVGGLLVTGSLAAARFAAWCTAITIPLLIGDILLWPLLQPLPLWIAEWRHNRYAMFGQLVFDLTAIAATWWLYWRLRAPQVLSARVTMGRATHAPWTAFLLGGVLLLTGFYAQNRQLDEYDVTRAREMAQAQYGRVLSYYVQRLFKVDGRVYADIVAYGEDQLFSFQIYWTPKP